MMKMTVFIGSIAFWAATLCAAEPHTNAATPIVALDDLWEDDPFYSAVPDALVLLNPITDLSTKWGNSLGEKAMPLSPLHHVSARTPPTLLIHGDSDLCVNIRAFTGFSSENDQTEPAMQACRVRGSRPCVCRIQIWSGSFRRKGHY